MDHNHNHDHDHNSCCDDNHNHNRTSNNNNNHNNNNNNHTGCCDHTNDEHEHVHDHDHQDKVKSDANDYSRFNDIDDSDDEIDKKTDDNKIKLPLEECIIQATSLKENGNDLIKNGNYSEAKEKYEKGIKLLDDHKNITSDIVINCLTSLHSNNAMACLKVGNYKNAIESSNFVLKHDQNNVKALFRRGSAYLQQHSFDEAKSDFTKVLEIDQQNTAAKKELASLVKLRKEYKEKEKSSFSGLFDKKSLYVDKEVERLKKIKREEEEKEKEIDLWTQSKLERRKIGLEEQTFEEWKKEKEDLEKKEKEEQEKIAEEKRRQESPKKEVKKVVKKEKEEDNDFDEEDEKILKEAASMKGYKIVDGKKTTYFNNELDQKTKQLIGDIAPKKLDSFEAPPVSSPSVVGSVWNQAGTFEEKDMTSYAIDKIKKDVDKTVVELEELVGTITTIIKSEGEASIVISRGKKRYLYDIKLTLKFEITSSNSEFKKIKGEMDIDDISPDSITDNSIDIKIKTKENSAEDNINAVIKNLKQAVINKITQFHSEFSRL